MVDISKVRAIDIHTPTITSVAGDAAKISTRVPPATPMLQTDFHDVLGKKPIVLVFATPQLCQSRICGPVVDVAMQVQASGGQVVAGGGRPGNAPLLAVQLYQLAPCREPCQVLQEQAAFAPPA